MIKALTLTTHLTHPFIMKWIKFYLHPLPENLIRALKFQYPKDKPKSLPTGWQISMKTDENSMKFCMLFCVVYIGDLCLTGYCSESYLLSNCTKNILVQSILHIPDWTQILHV